MQAVVLNVYLGIEGTHVSTEVEKLQCRLDGLEGDRHRMSSQLAVGQSAHIVDKGRPVANFRQVTIVTKEEMDAVAHSLRVSRLYAEDFSANIVLGNIDNFTQLPPLYYLVFSNSKKETHAVLRIMGENKPCVVAGGNMRDRFPHISGIQNQFVKAASGKRGQVAVVFAEGYIRPGDTVTFVPHQPV